MPPSSRWRGRRIAAWAGLAAGAFLAACASRPETPEDRLRLVVGRAARAAQEKDLGTLRDLIADTYADGGGRDKRTLTALLTYHMLQNREIYLFTRVAAATEPEPGRLDGTVLVAMAGSPISAAADLESLRADLYRFEIQLIREGGDWKLARAAWQRALPRDFF